MVRWKDVSQKYYSKNMSLMRLRYNGVADVKLVKLQKMGAVEFKTPESSYSNYRYFIRGCYLYRLLSKHFSLKLFFPKY